MSADIRPEHRIIAQWIQPKSHVLDLGCGDGTLLSHLIGTKSVTGYGVDVDTHAVNNCLEKAVPVIHADFDKGLDLFPSDGFDAAIMTSTLQASRDSGALLDEMFRVAKKVVVTFPNFGHWTTRVYLGLRGRMPMSSALPHMWYNTPNIHLCTFDDFEELCREKRISIIDRTVINTRYEDNVLMRLWPNLFGEIAIYHLERS